VGVFQTTARLRGIPQQGTVLGRPDAPVTLVEYADLQCPYCGVWARETLPQLVREYVRTGKVKLVFRGLAFVGPDSATGLTTALAAANQGRLWQVVDLVYANQGEENSGWLDDELLRSIGGQLPGLDVDRSRGNAARRPSPTLHSIPSRRREKPASPERRRSRSGRPEGRCSRCA